MSLFKMICMFLRAVVSNRARIAAENLALRQQLTESTIQRRAQRISLSASGGLPSSMILVLTLFDRNGHIATILSSAMVSYLAICSDCLSELLVSASLTYRLWRVRVPSASPDT